MKARRILFLFDGTMFTLVGSIVMLMPSAAPTLHDVSMTNGAMDDTRRLLAAAYITIGLFCLAMGRKAMPSVARDMGCRVRGASLLLLATTDLMQIFGGRWKPESLVAFVIVFGAMGLVYLYWGLIRPEARASQ